MFHYLFPLSALFIGSHACGADVSGSSSANVQFDINFFPPIAFTYNPTPYPGQGSTVTVVNTTVNNALNLAISDALKENSIYLASPPTILFTYTPPLVNIVDGDKCETADTYIANGGTVLYYCVGINSTDSPSTAAPEVTTAGSVVTVGSTAATTTAAAAVASTTEEQKIPRMSVKDLQELDLNLVRRKRSSTVQSEIFQQYMKITTTAPQALYENQWQSIAASVQKSLEARKVIFADEITVTLLSV